MLALRCQCQIDTCVSTYHFSRAFIDACESLSASVVFLLCFSNFLPKMARKRGLCMAEIVDMLENWTDEAGSEAEFPKTIVYVPPPNRGDVSDEEQIDENEMLDDDVGNPLNEIAGEIEVEFIDGNDRNDFAAPIDEQNEETATVNLPSMEPSTSVADLSEFSEEETPTTRTYRPVESFGKPNWVKTKRFSYPAQPEKDDLIEVKRKELVTKLGK